MFVIKLGGSLLRSARLRQSLEALIRGRPEKGLVVPGGGGFANVLRELDAVHRLPAEGSHQLALETMTLSGRLLARLWESCVLVQNRTDAERAWERNRIPIVDATHWPGIESLPATWDVTSDSIAAWIAIQEQADELVLAKSCDLPADFGDWHGAAARGAVDPYFLKLASQVPRIQWVNLKTEDQLPADVNQ